MEAVEFTADGGAADERTAVPAPRIEVVEAVPARPPSAEGRPPVPVLHLS